MHEISFCVFIARTVKFLKKMEPDMGKLNHIFTLMSRQRVGQNAWKHKILNKRHEIKSKIV